MVPIMNRRDLQAFVKGNEKVIVMYGMKNCNACEIRKIDMNEFSRKLNTKIKFVITYDDSEFTSFPMFVAYHNGKRFLNPVLLDFDKFKKLLKDLYLK